MNAPALDVPPSVAVVPMIRDGIEAHAGEPVMLSRVPNAGELLRLPVGDFIVRGVRHTPGCASAADVFLEPVITEAQRQAQLAAAMPADDQGSFAGGVDRVSCNGLRCIP